MARILVIEDDVLFLGLLRAHIAGAGHTVHVARDAAVGLRAIVADPPDLLLLDLSVPYLNGFELLEALRSDPTTQKMPVIVITGRDDDDAYEKASALGIEAFFTKPIQREPLMQAIEKGLLAGK